MRSRLCLCLVCRFGFVAVGSASAAAPLTQWAPSGRWVAHFDEQQCIAERPFALSSKEATVAVRREPTKSAYSFLIQTSGQFEGFNLIAVAVRAGAQRLNVRFALKEPSALPKSQIHEIFVDGEEMQKVVTAEHLSIDAKGLHAAFPLNGLSGVVKALEDCRSLLLEHWGFSKADQQQLESFPKPDGDVRKYISDRDYPMTAVTRGQLGGVAARVIVTAEGKATDCKLVRSSGWPILDKGACDALTKRVPFTPAKSKSGRPMAAPYFADIRFLM